MKFLNQTNSYYFDKILAWAFIMASIKCLLLTWDWPLDTLQLNRALPFLGISLICIVLAERRLFLIVGLLGILSIRLGVGLFLHPNAIGTVFAIIITLALFLIIKYGGKNYTNDLIPDEYSDKEVLLDLVSMPLFAYLIFILPRKWMG